MSNGKDEDDLMTELRNAARRLEGHEDERVARMILGELGGEARAQLEADARSSPELARALEQVRIPDRGELDEAVELAMQCSAPRAPLKGNVKGEHRPGAWRPLLVGALAATAAAAAVIGFSVLGPAGAALPAYRLEGLAERYGAAEGVRLDLRPESVPAVATRADVYVRGREGWRAVELPWEAESDGRWHLEVPAHLLVDGRYGPRELLFRVGEVGSSFDPSRPDPAAVGRTVFRAQTQVGFPAYAMIEARPTRAKMMAAAPLEADRVPFPVHPESGLVLTLAAPMRVAEAPAVAVYVRRAGGGLDRAERVEVKARGGGELQLTLPRAVLEGPEGRAEGLEIAVGEGAAPDPAAVAQGELPFGWQRTRIVLVPPSP